LNSNFKLSFFDTPVIHLDVVDSTNTYLKELKNNKPTLVLADYQSEGRGQYGKNWVSESEQNLLFSFQFFPKNTTIENAHLISQIVALEISEVLNQFLEQKIVTIKWPNDIILNNKKIGGILIETSLENSKIQNFIIGIGLNISQTSFGSELKNASSLKMEFPDIDWNRIELLYRLISRMEAMILNEKQGFNQTEIRTQFNQNLYKYLEEISLIKDNQSISATNLGVNESGQWILKNIDTNNEFIVNSSREVEYVY
jgi:BirA family transcriptional regulator, biotin operon repressor / biotin---[acetyl-CoA-carboxylase] ligase